MGSVKDAGRLCGLRARTTKVFIDATPSDLLGKDLGDEFIAAFGKGATPIRYSRTADLEKGITEPGYLEP